MVEIDHAQRTVRVKLVYYGPAVGGKTTNLKVLFDRALVNRKGQFVSVNSQQDRTILCDLLPLRSGGFRGHELKLQLLAVPGQAMYAMTRRVVLRGADGIAFIANSASDRWLENVDSLREMIVNLRAHELDPVHIPLVFQYNKRDLPAVTDIEALSKTLNTRGVTEFPAVATSGQGVLETFTTLLSTTIDSLCRRYSQLELPPGQTVEDWTRQAVEGIFGGGGSAPLPSIDENLLVLDPDQSSSAVDAYTDPGLPLKIRVAMPEEVRPPAGAEARSPVAGTAPGAAPAPGEVRSAESLAETYAEASAELGFVITDLREERDLARLRLQQVRRALDLATQDPGGTDLETRVRRVLQVLVAAGGATNAALILFTGGEARQVLLLPPLEADVFSQTTWGVDHIIELKDVAQPILEEASESAELAFALRSVEPSYEAAAIVPLRSAERLLGLALLYYGPFAVLPSRETLLHLSFVARVLAGPLEASAAREATSSAERSKVLSRASATAVASLLTRMPAELARRHRIPLVDVLAPLEAPGVHVEMSADAVTVIGDPPLLRFALATLIHQCEADTLERGQTPEVVLSGGVEGHSATIYITGGGRASVMSAPETGPDLADAELGVVQAIVALHGGLLEAGRGDNLAPWFKMTLVMG
jgi:signal recognition particle receptor subunit beta